VVAVRVALPGVGIGLRLRALERPVRCVEIVQLCLLDVVDQCPHHLAHQRIVEVITLVFERALEFLQAVMAEVVGNADRPWLLTPEGGSDGASLERLAAFATAFGAVPRVLSPAAHDRLMAYLSHLPQLAASAMMHVIGEQIGEEGLTLSGRGLADTTRLASSPAGVWQDICATSADEIGPALDRLIATLQELRSGLTDEETVSRVFESAGAWRARMLASEKSDR